MSQAQARAPLCNFIALCFATPHWAAERLKLDEERIPILLNLPAYAEQLSAPGPTLERALALEVNEFLRKEPEVATKLVNSWRDEGRLLVLLDGLDEVPDSLRPAVREEIVRFARSPSGKECRIVIASRTAGYTPLGADFKEYTLKPFEKPEEVRPYLMGWLAALKPEWKPQAKEHAERLLEGMQAQPALRRVMDNRLILRLSAEVYAASGEIVHSGAELYRRWIDEAWKRAVRRGAPQDQKEHALQVLEETAWRLHNGLDLQLAETDLVLLREKMGLLVRLNGYLAFAHATFREYFVARRLARAWRENREGAWATLRPRLHLPEWREPLLLLAGMLDERAAADLVQRVRRARSPYERYLRRDLLLALWLASEARLPPDALKSLLREARQLWRHKDAEVRKAAAEALRNIGSPKAIPALIEALKDKDAEMRKAAAEALGLIGSPEAVPALIEALQDKDAEVREDAAEALGKIGSPEAVPALIEALKDKDVWVRKAAARALGEIGSTEAVPALIEALRDEKWFVRETAAEALGEIGSPAIPALIEALRDEEKRMREAAAEALGKIGSPEAAPALIEALRDEEWFVRRAAVEALVKIGSTEAIPALIEALRDEEADVRGAAAKALRKIGSPEAVPALIEALRDEDADVRKTAARALGEIGSPEAVPALIEALRDEDADVRKTAARALGKIGSPEAIPALIEALRDEDWFVRQAAAEALAPYIARISPSSNPKERKDQEALVRQTARALARHRTGVYKPLSIAVAKLQELTLTYSDPFQPPPPSPWRRATRVAGYSLAAAVLLAAAGLLAIFSGATGELLREQWKAALQTWLSTHPAWALIALVAVAAALGGLLPWLLDRLRNSLTRS